MIRFLRVLSAACVLTFGSAGPTQDTSQLTSPAQCELHVWPAGELKAVTQGWIFNHTVNEAFNTAKGGIAKPETLLPEKQAELLANEGLPRLFGTPAARLVLHAQPLPRSAATASERNAPSASSCYSELIVSQLFYDKAPLAGASLRGLLVYRSFGGDTTPRTSFSTWSAAPLVHFPPKTPDEAEAANADLVQGYGYMLRRFAGFATAPRPRKKHGNAK